MIGVALNSKLASLPAVNGISDSWTHALISCSGSIAQKVKGKIIGDYAVIAGRVRISVTSRTAESPGVRVTIPNGKKIDGAFNVQCASSCYADGARNGEGTYIEGSNGGTTIDIRATESYANVASNKTLVLFVPPTVIKIKD